MAKIRGLVQHVPCAIRRKLHKRVNFERASSLRGDTYLRPSAKAIQ